MQAGFLTYEHRRQPADFVYCRWALHHLPDFWNSVALRRMRSFVRDGGLLRLSDVVYSFEPSDAEERIEAWCATLPADGDSDWVRGDVEEHVRDEHSTYAWLLEPMIERSGFRIECSGYSPRRLLRRLHRSRRVIPLDRRRRSGSSSARGRGIGRTRPVHYEGRFVVEVEPGVGVGPVRLGMLESDVAAGLGEPEGRAPADDSSGARSTDTATRCRSPWTPPEKSSGGHGVPWRTNPVLDAHLQRQRRRAVTPEINSTRAIMAKAAYNMSGQPRRPRGVGNQGWPIPYWRRQ